MRKYARGRWRWLHALGVSVWAARRPMTEDAVRRQLRVSYSEYETSRSCRRILDAVKVADGPQGVVERRRVVDG
ncbi:hypothetical protein C8R45DRAFT_152414 [Mycena sanguinolenta]|nr:hypothetical protein C8R45DRAFT_152414 [Mycena sanguinolenta]